MPGERKVTVLAAGHNKKVPLLLVGTHSNLLPGREHVKVWHSNLTDGTTQYYKKVTKQPEMHQIYREHMNHVDLHNKLRQGVVSMADVWQTTSWVERHFAEGLGLWEVNVYKALQYFQPAKWKHISHNEFRVRLAFAFMTLGKATYPTDLQPEQRRASFTSPPPPTTTNCPPPSPLGGDQVVNPMNHVWVYDKNIHKRCSYCGKQCHMYCKTCQDSGIGDFYACMKTTRGCTAKHVANETVKHYSFKKKKRNDASGSSGVSGSSTSGGGSASEDGNGHVPESPNSVARRMARAGHAEGPRARQASRGDASSSSTS